MSNGDEAMSPEEFAKLMGAYPEPAQNPLPAYGGYMDNSPANFAWVQNNDYFGADTDLTPTNHMNNSIGQVVPITNPMELPTNLIETEAGGGPEGQITPDTFEAGTYLDVEGDTMDMLALNGHWWSNDGITDADLKAAGLTTKDDLKGTLEYMAMREEMWGDSAKDVATVILRKGWGAEETFENPWDVPLDKYEEVFGMTNEEILENYRNLEVDDYKRCLMVMRKNAETFEAPFYPPEKQLRDLKAALRATMEALSECEADGGIEEEEIEGLLAAHPVMERFNMSQVKEAPYGGADALMDIGKETPLADFTGKELAESSAIHGDFDQASLNYSGHQNLEVRAEMEELTESMVDVSNRFGDTVGIISVEDDDDIDSYEDVNVEVQDVHGNVVENVTLADDGSWNPYEDDYRDAEMSKPSMLTLGLGAVAVIFGWPYLKDMGTKVFGADNDTQDMLENDPELVENPDTGDLDPAQYEELVVESTGYAVDVIPMGLDGSFMGSRFQALPTERYVEYNDPGIGAHTDVALNRDELFLEPEMAMVQAAEEGNEVKEAQAPGQSPYMSVDGQEPKDFNYRVIHEVSPISLDPAVKPFIPQSMTGYTGNKNTPPSVMNKMFNIGVLGQTPLFVAGQGDMGSSHTGSRDALPNSLGIAGSVGGPLSDQVNANYTDGTTSMSLAQWSIENTVSQTSDTEAVVIDRSSGMMKRIRRV